jgi:LPXTG-motif cell wall-anchored protein
VRGSVVIVLLVAGFGAAGLLVASPASACSCAEGPVDVHFADADAVFTGTLVSREVRHVDQGSQSSGDPALHVFEVARVHKGDVHELQGVVSAAEGGSCGLELVGDGPFVVFATRDPGLADGQYGAALCGGTTSADEAILAEVAELAGAASGQDPLAGAAGLEAPGEPPVGDYLWIGAGVLLVLGAGWWLRRRRKTS